MIDEANPSSRMFQKEVKTFLEGLPFLVVEHILRLEGLIDGQIDRVVGIRDTPGARFLRRLFAHLLVNYVIGRSAKTLITFLLTFQRRRNPLVVMRFACTDREGAKDQSVII